MKGLPMCESLVRLVVCPIALTAPIGCKSQPDPVVLQAVSIIPFDTVLCIHPDTMGEVLSIGDFQLYRRQVFILDSASRRVFCIDPESDSISSFGSQGEAPGCLMSPVAFVASGEVVRVVDASNGMVCFGSDGEYLEELSYFDNNLPLGLRPAGDSSFLGLRAANSFDENNELVAEMSVGLYGDCCPPSVEYCTFQQQMDLESIGTSVYHSMNSVRYAADESNGDAYISMNSTDRVSVSAYRPTGERFASIDEEHEGVEKSAGEMDAELIGIENHPLLGAFSSTIELDEFKPLVGSIGVDSLGNVWLGTASSDCPTFLVLSHSLEDTVMVVRAPDLAEETSYYDIRIGSSGIIACETREDGGSALYLLKFEGE